MGRHFISSGFEVQEDATLVIIVFEKKVRFHIPEEIVSGPDRI